MRAKIFWFGVLMILFAASMSRAGFVPRGAEDIRRGAGYVAYEKDGQERIVFNNRKTLLQEVAKAIKYASRNGGDLPDSDFWNTTADIYDDNVRLFAREHRCGPLLRLLRRDEIADARKTPPPILVPPRSPTGPLVPPKDREPDPVVETSAVPEPTSLTALVVGVSILLVGWVLYKSRSNRDL